MPDPTRRGPRDEARYITESTFGAGGRDARGRRRAGIRAGRRAARPHPPDAPAVGQARRRAEIQHATRTERGKRRKSGTGAAARAQAGTAVAASRSAQEKGRTPAGRPSPNRLGRPPQARSPSSVPRTGPRPARETTWACPWYPSLGVGGGVVVLVVELFSSCLATATTKHEQADAQNHHYANAFFIAVPF